MMKSNFKTEVHGFGSRSSILVNAEVDFMGGIVEGGIGIGTKTSPRRAAIDKAQAELRLEDEIRKERRRELEFLEKGGNPLDFIFGIIDPLSVQSSSLAVQYDDQLGNCEARGGFSSPASPVGDSIGSSGRLGATVICEPTGADNFVGENEIIESKGRLRYASRSNNTLSEEKSSQLSGGQNARDSEDSPIFHLKRAYKRRNRSKTNRDSARLGATDINSHGGQNSFWSDRHRVVSETIVQESPCDTEMDGSTVAVPTNGGLSEGKDTSSSKQNNDHSHHQVDKEDGVIFSMNSVEPDPCMKIKKKITGSSGLLACPDAGKSEKDVGLDQQREPDQLKGDKKCLQTQDSNLAVTFKGLDSDNQTSGSVDGNADSRSCPMKNLGSIEVQTESKLPPELTEDNKAKEILKDKIMEDIAESNSCMEDVQTPQLCHANGFSDQDQEETDKSHISAPNEPKCIPINEDIQPFEDKDSKVGLQQDLLQDSKKQQEPLGTNKLSETDTSCSVSVPEFQPCVNQTKVVDEAHEEQILEKARNILAKRKTIKDLSLGSLPVEYRGKTHWDFVLEEMAWMANDFAQERVWKRTSATQLCYRAALASRLRFGERDRQERDKVVARTMAKAVMDFWHSAALLVQVNGNAAGSGTSGSGTGISGNMDIDNTKVENASHNKDYVTDNIKFALQGYAVRFLQFNSSAMSTLNDATSLNPEGTSTIGTYEMKSQNQHAEEDLFYMVPHGAMKCYRDSVERHMAQCLRAGKINEEVNSSMYDDTEFEYQENGYEEDEGENAYYLPGAFEKKRSTTSSYNRIRISQSSVKRPANVNEVCPIPTKRVRTASRQRVVGPFSNGPAGFISAPGRTDVSSGDTNSFQDDESTLHGGSIIGKGLEVESDMDYDKQSAFDCAEFTAKPKKKKTKHQRNHFIRRSESHQLDSNSNYDPFVHRAKKPKIMKQSLDSIENKSLMSGSVASPLGSQMSNMSNSNKLIRLISGRDRGRKTKTSKMPSVQTGSGCPWSLFEDQALVVLVHDMGPNWELVSDAISSTLHFKCIFRKPKECKERHAILLEKSWGDGADTEDSGSSQPYPSSLPGIPKGGARQLFQQLRGPMEEDTIKSHFEKIISIGQKLHGRKKQDPKHRAPMHSSHLAALSQVIPNGGCILTPLDLCDMALPTSPDVFSGNYLTPPIGSLPLTNEAPGQPMPPSRAVSVRDGRHGISRGNIPIDDQQRIQQYKQLLSSRNVHQPNMSVPGTFSGNDQGARILPGGNGMSVPRPGLQGNMMGTTPNSLNMQPRPGVGQGVSMLRPRDAPVMRVSHGNSRGVPSISGLGGSFSSHSSPVLPGPTYPAQQQHPMHQKHSNAPLSNSQYPHPQASAHPSSTDHLRDRKLQQHLLQRQQQKQNSSQIQLLASSSSPVTPALLQHQQQQQLPLVQTTQTSAARMMSQSGRHHPVKGTGRGTMNNSLHLNSVSMQEQQPHPSQSSKPSTITPPNQQLRAHQHPPPLKLVNHRQPHIPTSAVSQNHRTKSDPVTQQQTDQSPAQLQPEQQTTNQVLQQQKHKQCEEQIVEQSSKSNTVTKSSDSTME